MYVCMEIVSQLMLKIDWGRQKEGSKDHHPSSPRKKGLDTLKKYMAQLTRPIVIHEVEIMSKVKG